MNKLKDHTQSITWKCYHERIVIFNFSNFNAKCSLLIFHNRETKSRD